MPDISSYPRIARFVQGPDDAKGKELFIRSEHGTFATHAEAEQAALKVADAANQDAVIIQDAEGFHVYGVDEISAMLPGGSFSGEVVREAPIVSFVATDPLTGAENVIGQRSAGAAEPEAAMSPTAFDNYVKKYHKQIDKVLGPEAASTVKQIDDLIHQLEASGLKITIEMDDDVFEYKDKIAGFKNLLQYALQNQQALQERSIKEIAVMDEWDGLFGTKCDLEYDKKHGSRRLEIGDDFLNDWGESLDLNDAKSVKKLGKELGATLSEPELQQRSEIFQDIRGSLAAGYDSINALQQASLSTPAPVSSATSGPASSAPTSSTPAAASVSAESSSEISAVSPATPEIQGDAEAPAGPRTTAPAGTTPATSPARPAADSRAARETVIREFEQTLDRLQKQVIPKAHDTFEKFGVKQERQISEKYLETFKNTLEALRAQVDYLKQHADIEPLEYNARLEKLKLLLVKGVQEIPDRSRNYLGSYVGGLGNPGKPSAGVEYSHAFGDDRETVASVQAGTSAPLKTTGVNKTDIMLGLGVSHTFHSRNKWLDGTTAGVGVGISRETPFFIGVSASNSWYLNDYHALQGEGSVVGGLHATIGSYTNIGATINVNKALGERVEFEGYGELSLLNQGAEIEGEFALNKDKSVYLTAGVGTNKLAYVGVGINDKYELEAGLGGVSLGKDSNNLPGESGWEVGLRFWPLPLPFFRHNRVPGYQMGYGDKSTEYITPNGTFMTIKQNAEGDKYRQAYIPDPKAAGGDRSIAYRLASKAEDLQHLDQAPLREISIGPLGYLTVRENGETIVEDGLIKKNLSEAELGIITDQAGVLWFDKMHPQSQYHSLGTRRDEMPLPLYRAVHY